MISDGTQHWDYSGFAQGVNADNATRADWMKTKNLIFGGQGGVIKVDAPLINLGAGYLTFNSNYVLENVIDKSKSGAFNYYTPENSELITGGFMVNKGATVIDRLITGAGQSLYKAGEGALVINGEGQNNGTINMGQGVLDLDQQGGHAADIIRLVSGRGEARLIGAHQLDHTKFIFGVRGGTLDMFGHDLTWNDIIHMDSGANIISDKAGSTSTFTFTGTGPKTYLGDFGDGGSLAKGLLNVVYAPSSKTSQWLLNGNITNKGGFDITKGQVVSKGGFAPQPVRSGQGSGIIDTDYDSASFDLGHSIVNVASGANFTVGRDSVATADFQVANGGSIGIASSGALANADQGQKEGAVLNGNVSLNGKQSIMDANISQSFTATSNANISGSGSFIKNGLGVLKLNGTNTFTGSAVINTGAVLINNAASLGKGENHWNIGKEGTLAVSANNIHLLNDILGKVNQASEGTLALSAHATDNILPTLSHYQHLFIGAFGDLTLGNAQETLSDTEAMASLRLGGGNGILTVESQLSGYHDLTIGNGSSTGTVILNNENNDFHGIITINKGMQLQGNLGNALVKVNYGGAISNITLDRISIDSSGVYALTEDVNTPLNLSYTPLLTLGAQAGKTVALNADPRLSSAGAYRFSGAGTLNVNTDLSGHHDLIIDGEDYDSGVINLNRANTFTGNVLISGDMESKTPTRVHGIAVVVNNNHALNSSNNVSLEQGAVLNLNGHSISTGSLLGDASSILTNFAKTASTLTVNQETNGVLSAVIDGQSALNIVKEGAAQLTLSGDNSFNGLITINNGSLALGSTMALGSTNNQVTINQKGLLDINGQNVKNAITLEGGALNNSGKNASINKMSLVRDSKLSGNIAFNGAINLNKHTLTLDNATLGMNPNTSSVGEGNLNLENSHLLLWGDDSAILKQSGKIIVNKGSSVNFRDSYESNVAQVQKIFELNGGTLANGAGLMSSRGNGGGRGINIAAPIEVTQQGGTIWADNWAFTRPMSLDGQISGSGDLNIDAIDTPIVFTNTADHYSGNWLLNEGHFSWAPSVKKSSLGTGNILIHSGADFTIKNNNDAVISNNIINNSKSAINKSGSGELTFLNNNVSGGLNDIQGNIAFDHTVSSGSLRFNSNSEQSVTAENHSQLSNLWDNSKDVNLSILSHSTVSLTNNTVLNNVALQAGSTLGFVNQSSLQNQSDVRSLMVNHWQGDNGTLLLNTQLGKSDSLTDTLDITGFVSGHTNVLIHNAGGLGAQTTGSGIKIISATTAENTNPFSLVGGSVSAGAFNYTLHQSNAVNENWYLSSSLSMKPNVIITTPTNVDKETWSIQHTTDSGAINFNPWQFGYYQHQTLQLKDNSILSGALKSSFNANVALSGHSQLWLNGYTLLNQIDVQSGSEVGFKWQSKLTNHNVYGLFVKNWNSDNGILSLNTQLGGSNSWTNHLMISGQVSGHTYVNIHNAGGLGAQTVGNGIQIITAASEQNAHPFSLVGGSVSAGAFNYTLHQVKSAGGHAWYLSSSAWLSTNTMLFAAINTDNTDAAHSKSSSIIANSLSDTETQAQNTDTMAALKPIVNYRNVVSVMSTVGEVARQESQQLMTIGQQASLNGTQSAWAKIINSHAKGSGQGVVSPNYDMSVSGVALGNTLWNNDHQAVNWYLGYQKSNADIQGFANGIEGTNTGSLNGKSYTLGLNWSLKHNNTFMDVGTQGSVEHMTTQTQSGAHNSVKSHNILASVMGGYHYHLAKNMTFTSSVGLQDSWLSLNNTEITGSQVSFNSGSGISGDLGGKLNWTIMNTKTKQWQSSLSVNVHHMFNNNQHVHFITEAANTNIGTQYAKDIMNVNIESDFVINHHVSINGHVGYAHSLGSIQYQGVDAGLGIKYNF